MQHNESLSAFSGPEGDVRREHFCVGFEDRKPPDWRNTPALRVRSLFLWFEKSAQWGHGQRFHFLLGHLILTPPLPTDCVVAGVFTTELINVGIYLSN